MIGRAGINPAPTTPNPFVGAAQIPPKPRSGDRCLAWGVSPRGKGQINVVSPGGATEKCRSTVFDSGYNQGYTLTMKTAISIPDDVFDAADEMAKRLGMSRSQLYATAVREYLDAHRSRGVTARLDRLYEHQDSRLDLRVAEAQSASLDDESW